MANWDDWKNRITDNFGSYLNKWLPNAILNTPYNLTAKSSGGEIFRGMLIAFLIIFGLIKLPKGGLLLFLYLGATMAVLLVWPEQYGGLRYFIAAIPFFIFLFFYGINAVILYLGKRRRKNSGILTGCLHDYLCPDFHVSCLFPGFGRKKAAGEIQNLES